MSHVRIAILTALAMLAFAGNSLLCRLALKHTGIDPASFTTIRLLSGALMLWLVITLKRGARVHTVAVTATKPRGGNWLSAFALFVYAAGFSFAYVSLPAATGALLLFGAVQATMIGHGMWSGERFSHVQWVGLVLAFCGLLSLLLPGLSAPPLLGSALMLTAGLAWGIYSLRGKGAGDPTLVTAGNFLRAVPMALVLSLLMLSNSSIDVQGVGYALASGALASGVGYAIWYTALPGLKVTQAATVQLSVPVLAALGGIVFLDERLTLRLILASMAILGGIALVIWERRPIK
ncbi:MAG: DMT family transporter [Burkholderiaceae bacterium]